MGEAILVLACTLPFLPALDAFFVADDLSMVRLYGGPDSVSTGRFFSSALQGEVEAPNPFYRPLSLSTFYLQAQSGASPRGFHLISLALHALNGVLLYRLCRRLAPGQAVLVLSVALFFSAHPRRVEAVVWISSRHDLLCSFFVLAALHLWIAREARPLSWTRGSLAAAAYLLALWSKEGALLIPVAGAMFIASDPKRRAIRPILIPCGVAAVAYLAGRRLALGGFIGGYGAESHLQPVRAVLGLLKHLVYPVLPPLEWAEGLAGGSPGRALLAGGVGAAAIGLGAALAAVGRSRLVLLGSLTWLAASLPTAPLPVSLTVTFNDRFLYLPGIGIALGMAGWGAAGSPRVRTLLTAALVAATVAMTVQTVNIGARWQAAGEMTLDLGRRLAAQLPPKGAAYLAASPDSIGGAYVLRAHAADAVAVVAGIPRPDLREVGSYFVDPSQPVMPLEVRLPSKDRLELRSLADAPRLLLSPGHPPVVETSGSDRYGRVRRATVGIDPRWPVLTAEPNRVRRVR